MSAYRPALRIALHDALRSKGRTALILCMIGLPVAAVVALGVVWKTLEWTPRESLRYEIGAADARLTGRARGPIEQFSDDANTVVTRGAPPAEAPPWTTAEITRRVAAEYGPDARVLPMTEGRSIELATSSGHLLVELAELDVRDPMARGILEITAGRAPAGPDEIALAPALAERGLGIGTTVRIGDAGTPKRVVGHVRDPYASPGRQITGRIAVALPGAVPGGPAHFAFRHWLIDAGGPVTWKDVTAFNRDGITVLSRQVVEHPPGRSGAFGMTAAPVGSANGTGAIAALAVSMVVLQVVLLAGPAFAVDVRRRRRLLALVAVSGGGPRHLRAVVLAGGLLLGGAGALAGALLGGAAGAVTTAVMRARADTLLAPFEVPWAASAATALLGVLSGLAAAYVPARQAARTDAVAALAGRPAPGAVRGGRGWAIAGAVLAAAGILGCLFGVRSLREFGAAFGAVAIIIGTVMIVPWLVGATGRVAGRLPVPLRLAVRDGARNRGRTAPAIAAIMAAVAGATALAIAGASDLEQSQKQYAAALPRGSALIWPGPEPPSAVGGGRVDEAGTDAARADEARAAIEREVPGLPLLDLRVLPGEDCALSVHGTCRSVTFTPGYQGADEVLHLLDTVVGGAAEARMMLGRDVPEVTAALAAGKIVVFGPRTPAADTTTATVRLWEKGKPGPRELREVRGLPAVTVAEHAHVQALVPPSAAERIGMAPSFEAFGVDRAEHRVTEAEAERVDEALAGFDGYTSGRIYVERGFTDSDGTPMRLLAAVAAVLTLGGALIVTGLSAADARPDLAVLAAVGARPRTRRLLAAGQAAFVAVLGSWLGIAAGLVPGIAAARPLTDGPPENAGVAPGPFLDIPWTTLLVIGVAIPLVTAAVAGLCTRSKPLGTRATAR